MEPLNLTRELVQNIMRVAHQHDERCQKDPLVAAQYLSALVGLLVGNEQRSDGERRELLSELHAFSEHVMRDVTGEARPSPPPVDPDKAFGIWKPPGA